jgi:hypothetical protein
MKKKISMLATALILTITVAFANSSTKEIPNAIQSDFSRHFATAQNVNWQKENDYYTASFGLHGIRLVAYYSSDQNFIGFSHGILSDKLPMMLQLDLKKDYQGYWITNLVEYSIKHEPGYAIQLENADESVTLKSNDLSNWYVYKKVKKD